MEQLALNWSKLLSLKEDDIKKIENTPAVFRFSKKGSDGKFYVFFVGSTANLKDELSKLISDKNENTSLKVYLAQGGDFSFRYALVEDENIRKAVEKQMYKHYAPELNTKEPSSPIEVKVNLS